MVDAWRIVALTESGEVAGQVAAWESLAVVLRWRTPGTWALRAPASQVAMLGPKSRLAIYRRPEGFAEQLVTVGYVDRIEVESTAEGRQATVSGTDVLGLLERRLVYPQPQNAAAAQTAARWTDSGPAEFVIHRLLTLQTGMGAQTIRQTLDSRIGTQVGTNLQRGGAGWSEATTGTVSWVGQVATLSGNSSVTLSTTDAINMGADMLTAVADVNLSGFTTCTVRIITNTTAAGAQFGESGAATYTNTQTLPAGLGAVAAQTFMAEVFRRRDAGHDWARIFFTWETGSAARTVTVNGGGVWRQELAGATINVSARFSNLAEEVESLCIAGGVRLSADFAGDRPRITVTPPVDKTAEVRFSTDYGNIQSWRVTKAAPRATRVVVAGAGEGAARVIRERFSTTAETTWGRRVEVFRDARDVESAETDTLDQRGDETLADQAMTSGFAVDVLDTAGMEFGSAYTVGDRVSLTVEGTTQDDHIAEVEIRADKNGTTIKPIVAAAQLADSEPEVFARVTRLTQRINGLERRR